MWLALIRQGRVRPAMTEEDSAVVRKVFPTVQGIYSLQMLVHIYKTKGLEYRNLLPEGTEDSMFSIRNMRLSGDVGGEDAVLSQTFMKLQRMSCFLKSIWRFTVESGISAC